MLHQFRIHKKGGNIFQIKKKKLLNQMNKQLNLLLQMYTKNSSAFKKQKSRNISSEDCGKTKSIQKSKKDKDKRRNAKITSSNYKTKRCDFFNRGSCGKGSGCTFSHNFIPDAKKKLCKFLLTGSCAKGEECSYSHNTKRYPCKFYHLQQICKKTENECRFSHGDIEVAIRDDFLKENEQMLISLFKDGKLPEKFHEYVKINSLLEKDQNSLELNLVGLGAQIFEKQNKIAGTCFDNSKKEKKGKITSWEYQYLRPKKQLDIETCPSQLSNIQISYQNFVSYVHSYF